MYLIKGELKIEKEPFARIWLWKLIVRRRMNNIAKVELIIVFVMNDKPIFKIEKETKILNKMKTLMTFTFYLTEIRSLDSDMQTLVYENYNKFISATDTIRKVREDISWGTGKLVKHIRAHAITQGEQIYKCLLCMKTER